MHPHVSGFFDDRCARMGVETDGTKAPHTFRTQILIELTGIVRKEGSDEASDTDRANQCISRYSALNLVRRGQYLKK